MSVSFAHNQHLDECLYEQTVHLTVDVLYGDLEAVEAPSLGHLERTQVINQSSTMTRLDSGQKGS